MGTLFIPLSSSLTYSSVYRPDFQRDSPSNKRMTVSSRSEEMIRIKKLLCRDSSEQRAKWWSQGQRQDQTRGCCAATRSRVLSSAAMIPSDFTPFRNLTLEKQHPIARNSGKSYFSLSYFALIRREGLHFDIVRKTPNSYNQEIVKLYMYIKESNSWLAGCPSQMAPDPLSGRCGGSGCFLRTNTCPLL